MIDSEYLPIPDRMNHVGGIESILMDGTRYFFGFDFKNDLVLSPLIDSVEAMAAFASKNMLQTDGKQDAAYWRALADEAIHTSELVEADHDREFTSDELRQVVASLDIASRIDMAIPGFSINPSIQYLLGAANGWHNIFDGDDIREHLQRLGLGEDVQLDDLILLLSGFSHDEDDESRKDVSYTDAARVMQNALVRAVKGAPANWSELFAPLIPID